MIKLKHAYELNLIGRESNTMVMSKRPFLTVFHNIGAGVVAALHSYHVRII